MSKSVPLVENDEKVETMSQRGTAAASGTSSKNSIEGRQSSLKDKDLSDPSAEEQPAAAEQPAAHAEQPAAHAEQPVAHADQPAAHAEQPVAHAEQPAAHAESSHLAEIADTFNTSHSVAVDQASSCETHLQVMSDTHEHSTSILVPTHATMASRSKRPGTEPKHVSSPPALKSLTDASVGTEWTEERQVSSMQDTSDLHEFVTGGSATGTYFQRVELMVDSKLTHQNIPMDVNLRSAKKVIRALEAKFGMRLTVSFSILGNAGRPVELPPLKESSSASSPPPLPSRTLMDRASHTRSASLRKVGSSAVSFMSSSTRSQKSLKRSPSRAYRMAPIREESLSASIQKSNSKHIQEYERIASPSKPEVQRVGTTAGEGAEGDIALSGAYLKETLASVATAESASPPSQNRKRVKSPQSTLKHSSPPTRRELKQSTLDEFMAVDPERRVLHCRPLFPSVVLLEQKYSQSSVVATPEFQRCTGHNGEDDSSLKISLVMSSDAQGAPNRIDDEGSGLYQGSLVASGHRKTSNLNETTPVRLSKDAQNGMIERLLYKSIEHKSRKLAALDAKFYPTEGSALSGAEKTTSDGPQLLLDRSSASAAALSPTRCISPEVERRLVDRLAGRGGQPSPQKLRSLTRAQQDNDAAMGLRPAPKVSSDERDQLTERFYNGGRDWKKKRLEEDERKQTKYLKESVKKRTKAEWDEWQERMARDIGKDIRLKGHIY